MKLFPAVVLLVLSLIFVSCQKEIEKQTSSSNHNTNPTSYLLRKVTIDHVSATNGEDLYFTYNSDNQISEIKRIQWGNGPINLTPPQKWYDTTTRNFFYQNGLAVKCIIKDNAGSIFRILEYTYTGNRLTVLTRKFDDVDIESRLFYRYDTSGRLIEVTDSSNKVNSRYLFEYNNNLTAVTCYNLQDTPQKKSKTEYSNFDGKVNFIKAVNGLPETYNSDGMNIHAYSSYSPNNYGEEKHYWDVEINQSFGVPTIGTYSYEYNDEGLPVKKQFGGLIWKFEYQKYK